MFKFKRNGEKSLEKSMTSSRQKIFFGFFLIYFIISIFDAYILIYIPLYYFNILNVNRLELAFIQIFTYLTLIILPILALFYDRYIKNESQMKRFFYFSFVPLCCSFLIFNLFKEYLILYGIFVCLKFISTSLIRTATTGIFLRYVSEGKTKTKILNRRLQLIFIVNSASALTYFIVSVAFNSLVLNVESLYVWNSFFVVGWVVSIPTIFLAFVYFRKMVFFEKNETKKEYDINMNKKMPNLEIISILILYIAVFLGFSDALYSYPKSEWIYNKFTETGFRIYVSTYFLFTFCTFFGYYLFYLLNKRYHNHRKLILITISLYTPLMFLITVSTFPSFMLLQIFLSILGSIANLTYVSHVTDISIQKKHRTFIYQLLTTPSTLANIIFLPLGTYLSNHISFESLVVISCFLFIISIFLLGITFFLKKKETVQVLEYHIESIEKSQVS